MEISKYSRHRFMRTFAEWEVPKDYADPMYNYFVHGFSPGSFFTAVLANNFMDAMSRSHPANTIKGLRALVDWLRSTMSHGITWGSYDIVKSWLNLSESERREKLELLCLVYSEKEEIVKILKDEPSREVHLW